MLCKGFFSFVNEEDNRSKLLIMLFDSISTRIKILYEHTMSQFYSQIFHVIQMNLIKRLYDKVIVDDYIQPLTAEYVSAVLITAKRKRKQSRHKQSFDSSNIVGETFSSQQSLEQIPDTGNDEIQNIFRRISKQYQRGDLNSLQIQLIDKLRIVKKVIVAKSPMYLESIDSCLTTAEEVVSDADITKPKVVELKQRLRKLQMTRAKSQKIVNLRIKYNNIKLLSNYLQKLPNLNQLKLPQLKRICLQEWLKQLKCYKDIQQYIKTKSDQIYSEVLELLDDVIHKFDEKKYRGIVHKYIQLEIQTSLDQLILSVLSRNIRKFDVSYMTLCYSYVNYMSNFFQIYLFHKNNENIINIKDKMFSLCPRIWSIMEQHLVEIVRESIGLSAIEIFQFSCHLNRLVEIGEGFRGSRTEQDKVLNNIKNHASKIGEELGSKQTIIFNSTFNKYLISVSQSLNIEQSNQWSRLPVDNSYRYTELNNMIANFANRAENAAYKKLTANDFYFLRKVRNEVKMPSINQTWQICQYNIDTTPLSEYKIKSISSNLNQLKITKDVIISQSIIPFMKFYQEMSEYVFSLRLVTQNILAFMFFLTNFYIYFIFMTFTPGDVKKLIFAKTSSGAKQTYEKAKVNAKYPSLVRFINTFQDEYYKNGFDKLIRIPQSKLEQQIVRARVVALQSFQFLYRYLQFCITNLKNIVPGVARVWQRVEKRFKDYPDIQKQLAELLYSECIYKLTNIQPLLNPLWKIAWDDEAEAQQSLQQGRITLELYMKDFFKRLEATGKGEIPSSSVAQIYTLFCKYISRYIQNKLIRLEKITVRGKEIFVEMLLNLQKEMNRYQNYPNFNFTEDIVQLINISKSNDWAEVQEFIKQAINKCNLSYTGLAALAFYCKASEELPKSKREERGKIVQEYIKKVHG